MDAIHAKFRQINSFDNEGEDYLFVLYFGLNNFPKIIGVPCLNLVRSLGISVN